MAQKHLKELLKEDQEPFYLKDYIADKQCLLNKQAPRTQIKLRKAKPMSETTSIFCRNACFFSLQDSPDIRKSPLFANSPVSKKSPNRVFLHVPAKTASLLLEAAMRIQKQSKPKNNRKGSGFGLFGSVLKRLTLRKQAHKINSSEVVDKKTEENRGNVRKVEVLEDVEEEKATCVASVTCSSCSSCNGRSSSIDFESCSSGRSFEEDNEEDDDDEFEFTNVLKQNNNEGDYGALCLSPFRFGLCKSPSPSPSPAKSPTRHKFEDNVKYEEESTKKYQLEAEEEDKEQNSPVSVLDPPFDDDYDVHEGDGFDEEGSYAFVQRAKQQLLHKLHRFEKLAELDPIELEKRMIEEEDQNDNEHMQEQVGENDEYDYESFTFVEQIQVHELLEDVIRTSAFRDIKKPGMKRLISDLILEEESVEDALDVDNNEQIIKRACKRLDSWKEVECNTIDMMVEMDLWTAVGDWKKPQSEICDTGTDIEGAIFALLVKELVEDLACSA